MNARNIWLARIRRVTFRADAWKRMFMEGDPVLTLTRDGEIALAHIKRYARFGKPPVVHDKNGRTDPFETGRAIGRQEMVQLIVEMLELDERVLVNLQEVIPDE